MRAEVCHLFDVKLLNAIPASCAESTKKVIFPKKVETLSMWCVQCCLVCMGVLKRQTNGVWDGMGRSFLF